MRQLLTSSVFVVLAGASAASAADQIRMLAPTWLGFAPVHIAQELGWSTSLKPYTTGQRSFGHMTIIPARQSKCPPPASCR